MADRADGPRLRFGSVHYPERDVRRGRKVERYRLRRKGLKIGGAIMTSAGEIYEKPIMF